MDASMQTSFTVLLLLLYYSDGEIEPGTWFSMFPENTATRQWPGLEYEHWHLRWILSLKLLKYANLGMVRSPGISSISAEKLAVIWIWPMRTLSSHRDEAAIANFLFSLPYPSSIFSYFSCLECFFSNLLFSHFFHLIFISFFSLDFISPSIVLHKTCSSFKMLYLVASHLGTLETEQCKLY